MSIESSHDSQPAQNSGAGTDVSRQNVQPFAAQALARSRLISDIAKVSLKKDVSDTRQHRWSLNDWAVALGTLRVQNSQWLHIYIYIERFLLWVGLFANPDPSFRPTRSRLLQALILSSHHFPFLGPHRSLCRSARRVWASWWFLDGRNPMVPCECGMKFQLYQLSLMRKPGYRGFDSWPFGGTPRTDLIKHVSFSSGKCMFISWVPNAQRWMPSAGVLSAPFRDHEHVLRV